MARGLILDPVRNRTLEGKTALVAGGAGNVGEGIVAALIDRGATVVVPSRSAEKLAALTDYLGPARAPRLLPFESDVGDFGRAAELVDQVVRDRGGIDLAVAGSGQLALAQSFGRELRPHGVRVLQLFVAKVRTRERGRGPQPGWITPEDIGHHIVDIHDDKVDRPEAMVRSFLPPGVPPVDAPELKSGG